MTVLEYIRGLSPRLRGNHNARFSNAPVYGSIPAPAGEPFGCRLCRLKWPVYPRACGGTGGDHLALVEDGGLSPRLRGNHETADEALDRFGSIPAPAGEPAPPSTSISILTVYPRACGGTHQHRCFGILLAGLSPRLRGNHHPLQEARACNRSIPAPAGEPASAASTATPATVYPRACGGTCESGPMSYACKGLSPRLRGNLGATC